MIQDKSDLHWTEPRDYPLPSGERKVVKEQFPPCPNGCGNEEVHRAEKPPRENQKEIPKQARGHSSSSVTFYFCEHCMSFFRIKIQDAPKKPAHPVSTN